MLSKYGWMTIALAALAVLSACAGPEKDVDLDSTKWVLASLDGENPLTDTQITLAFEGGVAGGFAGCNAYGTEQRWADDSNLGFSYDFGVDGV